MTADIDPAAVRVLYRRPTHLVLGPLGCFYEGQRVVVDGVDHTITSVDRDGAGVARSEEMLAAIPNGVPPTFNSQPCRSVQEIDASPANQRRIQAGMDAQQERNRREHGVVLPGEMAQAA